MIGLVGLRGEGLEGLWRRGRGVERGCRGGWCGRRSRLGCMLRGRKSRLVRGRDLEMLILQLKEFGLRITI
jgi:hypothetical protein